MKKVSTSFLCENSSKDLINVLNNTNTDYIHFDVMDGLFVSNRFLTIKELKEVLSLSKKKNDIHLMVKDPSSYINEIKSFPIEFITIHYEIDNLEEVVKLIRENNIKVGLAIKPETNIESIYYLLDKIDMILIMSVEPGKSGQKFIDSSIDKVSRLKSEINKRGLSTLIEIDGGINDKVLPFIKDVDIVVSSSYVLSDFKNIDKIRNS